LSLAAPDALFQREMLAAIRRDAPPRRDFVRVVIAADDWQAAAAEALASKWAGQLPRRAAEIARLLRG
jgi:hypothetical protein